MTKAKLGASALPLNIALSVKANAASLREGNVHAVAGVCDD